MQKHYEFVTFWCKILTIWILDDNLINYGGERMKIKRGIRIVSLIMVFALMMPAMPGKAATGTMITITADGQVVDTLNGVSSIYRPGGSDGTDSTYSCAAFIWKYYQAVYGVIVYNLWYNQIPLAYNNTFVQVAVPQVGDICAQVKPASLSNHWSIVKAVDTVAGTVTVIDQNNKWYSNGVTYAWSNYTYGCSEVKFYRLSTVAPTVTPVTTEVTQATTATTPKTEVSNVSASSVGTATKVKLNYKDVTIAKKQKFKLKATLKPAGCTDAVSFSSSNKKIAKVSRKGTVTGKRVGTCKITVTAASGKKKKCIVRVIKSWS